jgi:hypothetical protein
MAKAKEKTTAPEATETKKEATPITVTIHINVNGRVIARTITVKSEKEIDEKVQKITRNVKFFGSILVRVLLDGKSAEEVIFKRIEKVLSKN